MNIVEVKDLTKKYGTLTAVDGISFAIEKGEVFGLLGPNGAGKTTTVEMIEGLRKPDGGSIEVCGINGLKQPDRIKEIIGVQLQSTTLYDKIKVKEAIDLFGGYYRKSLPTAQLMADVSLTDKKDSFVGSLSGGQRQRVAMALALVNDPDILFLDEPTTGLDPQARHNVWSIIEALRDKGKTIILTTHYMEEAEHLCQRVGIIDHGKIIALDSPYNLVAKSGLETTIEFTTQQNVDGILAKLTDVSNITREDNHRCILSTRKAPLVLRDLTHLCYQNNVEMDNISVRKATLEDVFLALTGRKLRE